MNDLTNWNIEWGGMQEQLDQQTAEIIVIKEKLQKEESYGSIVNKLKVIAPQQDENHTRSTSHDCDINNYQRLSDISNKLSSQEARPTAKTQEPVLSGSNVLHHQVLQSSTTHGSEDSEFHVPSYQLKPK